MTIETILVGALPNDGTGDPLRVAFEKINNNFANILFLNPGGSNGSIQFNNAGTIDGSNNFIYDAVHGNINILANIIPLSNAVSIGTNSYTIANLYLANNSLKIGNVSISESANIITLRPTANSSISAGINVGTVTANGDISTSGNITVSGTVQIADLTMGTLVANTIGLTANQIIYQAPVSSFSTIRFEVTSKSVITQDSQAVSIVANRRNNGTGVVYVVSGTLFQGQVLTTYNVDVLFGNVRLMLTPLANLAMNHYISYVIDI